MLYCIVWESIDYLSIVLERLRPGRYLEFFICMKSERTIGRGQWSFKTGNLWELDDTCSSHSQTFDKFDRHPPTIIQFLKIFSQKSQRSNIFHNSLEILVLFDLFKCSPSMRSHTEPKLPRHVHCAVNSFLQISQKFPRRENYTVSTFWENTAKITGSTMHSCLGKLFSR